MHKSEYRGWPAVHRRSNRGRLTRPSTPSALTCKVVEAESEAAEAKPPAAAGDAAVSVFGRSSSFIHCYLRLGRAASALATPGSTGAASRQAVCPLRGRLLPVGGRLAGRFPMGGSDQAGLLYGDLVV